MATSAPRKLNISYIKYKILVFFKTTLLAQIYARVGISPFASCH